MSVFIDSEALIGYILVVNAFISDTNYASVNTNTKTW